MALPQKPRAVVSSHSSNLAFPLPSQWCLKRRFLSNCSASPSNNIPETCLLPSIPGETVAISFCEKGYLSQEKNNIGDIANLDLAKSYLSCCKQIPQRQKSSEKDLLQIRLLQLIFFKQFRHLKMLSRSSSSGQFNFLSAIFFAQ